MTPRKEIVRRLTDLFQRKPHVTEVNVSVEWLRTLMEPPAADVDPKVQPPDAKTRRKRTTKPDSPKTESQ